MIYLYFQTPTFSPPQHDIQRAGENGNWQCSDCGNVNFSYRNECNRCGQAKPQGIEVRLLRIWENQKLGTKTTCVFFQWGWVTRVVFFGWHPKIVFFFCFLVVVILALNVRLRCFSFRRIIMQCPQVIKRHLGRLGRCLNDLFHWIFLTTYPHPLWS